jgi:hypothetical protein
MADHTGAHHVRVDIDHAPRWNPCPNLSANTQGNAFASFTRIQQVNEIIQSWVSSTANHASNAFFIPP